MECKIYVGLTTKEAKLLAWDHNNDNDYRQKMSSIERIYHEYHDVKQKYGANLYPTLQRHCLHEVGIVVDNALKSNGVRKCESWFQLVFRDVEVWDPHDQIFTMWEIKEVKGQRQKKIESEPTTRVEEHRR